MNQNNKIPTDKEHDVDERYDDNWNFSIDFNALPHEAPEPLCSSKEVEDDVVGLAGLERVQEALMTALTICADIATDSERNEVTRDVASKVYADIDLLYEWLASVISEPERIM